MAALENHHTLPLPAFDRPVRLLIVVAPYYRDIADNLIAGARATAAACGAEVELVERAHRRLKDALRARLAAADWPDLELLVVDNDSVEPASTAAPVAGGLGAVESLSQAARAPASASPAKRVKTEEERMKSPERERGREAPSRTHAKEARTVCRFDHRSVTAASRRLALPVRR